MKPHDTIIQDLRENFQEEPSMALRNRIYKSAIEKPAASYIAKRKMGLSAAIIATMFALFSLTTAFAYGGEIIAFVQQFMFGNSSAEQAEKLDGYVIGFDIIHRSDLVDWTKNDGGKAFTTIEEANEFAAFTIKLPTYLPDNVIGLETVYVQKYKDGTAGYDVHVRYSVQTPNGTTGFSVNQYYAGPDAYVELKTIHPIQKVMVGDAEASLVHGESSFNRIGYHLYWMKDDILYEYIGDCYDLETILAIASSM